LFGRRGGGPSRLASQPQENYRRGSPSQIPSPTGAACFHSLNLIRFPD